MHCNCCGEQMEGDGFTIVVHCPNVDVSYMTPDCDPVYCETDDEHSMFISEKGLCQYEVFIQTVCKNKVW